MATGAKRAVGRAQEVCIDLPGEAVQCWRSQGKIRVTLRKHRDIFFDINLVRGAEYTIESRADFYSPRDKKLLRRASFSDGEIFNVWVGRSFSGTLVLKSGSSIMGKYKVNELDTETYAADPNVKPEPLMVIMGERHGPVPYKCSLDDPFGLGVAQDSLKISFEPKMSALRNHGSKFDYLYPADLPEVTEYVVVTEAAPDEIQSHVLKQLDDGTAVVGAPGKIFTVPKNEKGSPSLLRVAVAQAAGYISGSALLNDSGVKETLGYMQENLRSLDKLSMTARIEKKSKGKYRVLLKGCPLSQLARKTLGFATSARKLHERVPLGSEASSFLDGGFAKTGKAGYGGAKRLMLTVGERFKGGLKIQAVGTVIDLIVDANTVYFDEKGSQDLSEFLARAGVSLLKAGATAAIGSMIASAIAGALLAAGSSVLLVAVLVVAGYVVTALAVDWLDSSLQIKEHAANAAR